MKHTQSILKTQIADDEVHLIGYLGAISGLGFSFGPWIGGIIYHFHGFAAVSFTVASVFLINSGLLKK